MSILAVVVTLLVAVLVFVLLWIAIDLVCAGLASTSEPGAKLAPTLNLILKLLLILVAVVWLVDTFLGGGHLRLSVNWNSLLLAFEYSTPLAMLGFGAFAMTTTSPLPTPPSNPSSVPVVSPFIALLHSRKFLLMALDVVLSIVMHFVTEYASVKVQMDVQFLTLALQPVVVVLIGAIAYEDAHS